MNRVAKKVKGINGRKRQMEEVMRLDPSKEARLAAIQLLIPLGLKAVEEELNMEFEELVGNQYARGKAMGGWGHNNGSVYLGDQKVRIRVPRVRSKINDEEIPLLSYLRLKESGVIEETAFKRVVNGISMRKYEDAVLSVPETFGIKRGSISRKWIRASSRKLKEMTERNLKDEDIVAMIMDGKSFGENGIITAMGVAMNGEKIILGFIEAGTENHGVCRDFLNDLIARGLNTENEMLFVLDGGKGLRKAVEDVFGKRGLVQRCQWHKRENVLEYLSHGQRVQWRKKLQEAYELPTYAEAKSRLESLKKELRLINLSAVKSLEEGLEETLTLHRLGMFEKLGTSLKTTNCLENLNRQLGIYTDRVCRWKSSDQRQRWVASALLKIEPKLRKIRGYRHLPELRKAIKELFIQKTEMKLKKAA